jgi:flagellar hook-associated protein 2
VGLSSAGIGSGLDVDSLVSKLMSAESAPLGTYAKTAAEVQSQIAAYGKVSGAVGTFQGALSSLSSFDLPRAFGVTAGEQGRADRLGHRQGRSRQLQDQRHPAGPGAEPDHGGKASTSAMIGAGAKTVLTFQFGSVSGGSFGVTGTALGAGRRRRRHRQPVRSPSTAPPSPPTARPAAPSSWLPSSTPRPKRPASPPPPAPPAPPPTCSAALRRHSFGTVTPRRQQLQAGRRRRRAGFPRRRQHRHPVSAASIDSSLSGTSPPPRPWQRRTSPSPARPPTAPALRGRRRLQHRVTETVTGDVKGGLKTSGNVNIGSTTTATAGVSLSSSGTSILVGGSNPALPASPPAPRAAISVPASAQDGAQASGTVTLEASDQSLPVSATPSTRRTSASPPASSRMAATTPTTW